MIAYDTDVLVELLKGNPHYASKAQAIPREDQFVPIVVVEEIQRGRLNNIRQAEGELRSIAHTNSSSKRLLSSGTCRCFHTQQSLTTNFKHGAGQRLAAQHMTYELPQSALPTAPS